MTELSPMVKVDPDDIDDEMRDAQKDLLAKVQPLTRLLFC